MFIRSLNIRFYRSFNYDYLRRQHESPSQNDWEMIAQIWCPFVSVPIGRHVTAVAGANESGKTHFLNALECALRRRKLSESDFCRYSDFYSVALGETRFPDLGIELASLNDHDKQRLSKAFQCKVADITSDPVRVVYYNGTDTVLLLDQLGSKRIPLRQDGAAALGTLLPQCHLISASTPLPDTVPLAALTCNEEDIPRVAQQHLDLGERAEIVSGYQELQDDYSDETAVQNDPQGVVDFFKKVRGSSSSDGSPVREMGLARSLLLDIAGVDPRRFARLGEAARANDEGELRLIEDQVNQRLNSSLSLPKWWMQDQDFRLQIRTRGDSELAFSVSDRTAATYTFAERSSGLKYFLSYHLQFLLLKSSLSKERGSVILMDEPDSFLSSDGQADLLRLMHDLAQPLEGLAPVQVIYVTHSPYLIDRNQADSVRLLAKGVGDEGVRVIGYAGQRLFEPIHSALGAPAGETARAGRVNLVVEGVADQSILFGVSAFLTRRQAQVNERLDMNLLAIVPAEGASNVPFEVFALRSRAQDCPPVVVLLDSDDSGDTASGEILGGRIGKRKLLEADCIVQVGDIRSATGLRLPKRKATPIEIEDLIPETIAVAVARRYVRLLCSDDEALPTLTAARLAKAREPDTTLFKVLRHLVAESVGDACRIEKRPFARLLAELLEGGTEPPEPEIPEADYALLAARFGALFARLNEVIEKARDGDTRSRMADQVSRRVRRFISDHGAGATTTECRRILSQIEQVLVTGDEAAAIRVNLAALRDRFGLHQMAGGNVADFDAFKEQLSRIATLPQQMASMPLADRAAVPEESPRKTTK